MPHCASESGGAITHSHSRSFSDIFSTFFDAIRCRSSVSKRSITSLKELKKKQRLDPKRGNRGQAVLVEKEQNLGAEDGIKKSGRDKHGDGKNSYDQGKKTGRDCSVLQNEKDPGDQNKEILQGVSHSSKKLDLIAKTEYLEARSKLFDELQSLVKQLRRGSDEEQGRSAEKIRHITKDNAWARETLSMLGAIPFLISLLDLSNPAFQNSALFALLNLAIGNDINKAAISASGAIPKIVDLLEISQDSTTQEAATAALLSLSALDANKPIIGSSGAIPLLKSMLENKTLQSQAKKDALRAIYNLSICPTNASFITEAGAIPVVLNLVKDPSLGEKSLAVLGNLAATEAGRKSMAERNEILEILVGALEWENGSKSQELAVYVLMILAHHSWAIRQGLIRLGAVSSLLEVVLLGSTLAQKRASRILECLREERQKGRAISAPITTGSSQSGRISDESEICEERRIVNRMVNQSLQRNMDRIIRRARLPSVDFGSMDRIKALASSPSSRSLPPS